MGDASIFCTTTDNVNGVWNKPAPECKGEQQTAHRGPGRGYSSMVMEETEGLQRFRSFHGSCVLSFVLILNKMGKKKNPNTQIIKKDVIWDKDLKNAANSLCPFSSLLVNVCSKNHGFIAWLRLEGALKIPQLQPPTYVSGCQHQIRLPTPRSP